MRIWFRAVRSFLWLSSVHTGNFQYEEVEGRIIVLLHILLNLSVIIILVFNCMRLLQTFIRFCQIRNILLKNCKYYLNCSGFRISQRYIRGLPCYKMWGHVTSQNNGADSLSKFVRNSQVFIKVRPLSVSGYLKLRHSRTEKLKSSL